MDCKIMTWAEVGCLTDGATQAPQEYLFMFVYFLKFKYIRGPSDFQKFLIVGTFKFCWWRQSNAGLLALFLSQMLFLYFFFLRYYIYFSVSLLCILAHLFSWVPGFPSFSKLILLSSQWVGDFRPSLLFLKLFALCNVPFWFLLLTNDFGKDILFLPVVIATFALKFMFPRYPCTF